MASTFEYFRCLHCGFTGEITTAEIARHRSRCANGTTEPLPGVVPGRPYVVGDVPSSLRRMVDDEQPLELEITPAGVAGLSELAEEMKEDRRVELTAERKREQLIFSLLCAARGLAQANVRARHTIDAGSSLYCGECQVDMAPDPLRGAGEHHQSCRTGLVLMILSELAKLPKKSENAAFHFCPACGLTDGAWVSEEMPTARAAAYGLSLNQRYEIVDEFTRRVQTHLCPEALAGIGGAA